MTFRTATLIVLLILPALAAAEDARIDVPVGQGAHLVFQYPPGWQAKVTGPGRAPSLRFAPAAGSTEFSALVMPFPKLNGRPSTDMQVEEDVRKKGTALLPTAVHKEISLVRVAGKESSGYLFHLTQHRPEGAAGDAQELHQGSVMVGDYVLHVTIVTYPGDSASLPEILKVIESVHFVPAPRRVAKTPSRTHPKH